MTADRPGHGSDRRPPLRTFALVSIAVLVAVLAYALYSRGRQPTVSGADEPITADASRIVNARQRPHILFRITDVGPAYGHLGIVPLENPKAPPIVAPLECDRVYASSTDGLCLQADRGVFTTYRAVAFDERLAQRHAFPLEGAPSRTRVAHTAPLGASTVFVRGDSYAAGGFSTRTTLFDLESNVLLGDLEQFTVLRDGQPFKQQDFNFWGVTFGDDGDTFFATLATGGTLLLVKGSVTARRLSVIGDGVECPMLSPDGTRLAYKWRVFEGGRVSWRLRVMDLASRKTIDLSETRNVDDQPEWLDDRRVLYALPREGTGSSDVWTVRADGTGSPELFIPNAFSPSVVSPRAGVDGAPR